MLSQSDERSCLEAVLSESVFREEFERRMRIGEPVSGRFRQWIINVYAECHLTRKTWSAFVEGVIRAEPNSDLPELTRVCTGIFRDFLSQSFGLLGPEADVDEHTTFGRVVPHPAFVTTVKSFVGGSRTAAMDLVRFLIDRSTADWNVEWLKYPAGQHVMWATFCEEDPKQDPFDPLPTSRSDLRCLFGLPWDASQLLLLTYKLPPDIRAFLPTIVEAYAGDWTVFFRPADRGARFGRIMPRAECDAETTLPEIVHRPVTLGAMSQPPRVL
jgi:hypothetical protein